jgi:cytochrome c biogenesis protein CcmG/thiol:disulfide interchange protein DsbE
MTGIDIDGKAPKRWSKLGLVPLLMFLALAALFCFRLFSGDASRIPSALIGHQVPVFSLNPVDGLGDRPGFADSDLRQGHVTLVNIFASWCVPCRDEHKLLVGLSRDPALAAQGVQIFGIAYKDAPENTKSFLVQGEDPYARIGADRSGRTGIDFGVYGVPETFIVKGDGTIAYKFIGPMSEESIRQIVLPEIEKAAK